MYNVKTRMIYVGEKKCDLYNDNNVRRIRPGNGLHMELTREDHNNSEFAQSEPPVIILYVSKRGNS